MAEFTVGDMQLQGSSEVGGSARAVAYRSVLADDRPSFTFDLQAESVHFEADHAQGVYQAGVEVDHDLWTDRSDYGQSAITAQAARPHFKLEIFEARPGSMTLHHASDCLDVAIPAEASVAASKFTPSNRTPTALPTAGSLQAGLCQGSALVEGDFLVALWETDIRLAGDGGSATYHSGMGAAPARGPEGTTVPANVSQSDQLYLTVTKGRLVLQHPGPGNGDLTAFVTDAAMDLVGTVRLAAATGTIQGAAPISTPSKVVLDGDLHLDAVAADRAVELTVDGDSRAVAVNGIALSTAATTAVRAPHDWALASIPGLAVLLLVWWAFRRRRTGEGFYFRWARLLFRLSLLRPALVTIERATRRSPTGDTHALQARILFDLGRYEESMRSADQAHPLLVNPLHRGANAMVGALAAARTKEPNAPDETATWFLRACEADPRRRGDLDEDPALLQISVHPAFQSRLRGNAASSDLLRP